MDGLLDEVQIWDSVLSAAEIEGWCNCDAEPPRHPRLTTRGARASSELTGGGQLAIHADNEAGIFGMTHSAQPQGNMWLTAPDDPSPELTIDLGRVHAIDDLRIWNYNDTNKPAQLKFQAALAMAQYRLGRKQQAQMTLAGMREAMKNPHQTEDAKALVCLREAEALIEGEQVKPQLQ